jgi:hypothetical protein
MIDVLSFVAGSTPAAPNPELSIALQTVYTLQFTGDMAFEWRKMS